MGSAPSIRAAATILACVVVGMHAAYTGGCGRRAADPAAHMGLVGDKVGRSAADLDCGRLAAEVADLRGWPPRALPTWFWRGQQRLMTSDLADLERTDADVVSRVQGARLVIVCDRHDVRPPRDLAARVLGLMRAGSSSMTVGLEIVPAAGQGWLDELTTVPGPRRWSLFAQGASTFWGASGYEAIVALLDGVQVRPVALGERLSVDGLTSRQELARLRDDDLMRRMADRVVHAVDAVRSGEEAPCRILLLIGGGHILADPLILSEPRVARLRPVILVPSELRWQLTLDRRAGYRRGVWYEVLPSVFCPSAAPDELTAMLEWETFESPTRPLAPGQEPNVDLGDRDAVRFLEAAVFGGAPEQAVPRAKVLMASAEAGVRVWSARVLSWATPCDLEAADLLLGTLDDPSWRVRREAALALRAIGAVDRNVVGRACVRAADEAGLDGLARRDLLGAAACRLVWPELVVPALLRELQRAQDKRSKAELLFWLASYGMQARELVGSWLQDSAAGLTGMEPLRDCALRALRGESVNWAVFKPFLAEDAEPATTGGG